METGKIWESAWTDRWTLKLGDKGLTVALWQRFLMDKGLMERRKFSFDDNSISGFIGVFESATLDATKKYQKNKGLNDDGIVGFSTYSKASEEGFDGIAMEMGIVFALNRMNWNPNSDSSFEVVFSSKGSITFKGIHNVPEVLIGSHQELSANEALREFRNTFIG